MWFRIILIKFLSGIILSIMLWSFYLEDWIFSDIESSIIVIAPFILQFCWELIWGGVFKFKSAIAMYIYNVFGVDSIILSLYALIGNNLTESELIIVMILKGLFCLYYQIGEDKKTRATNPSKP